MDGISHLFRARALRRLLSNGAMWGAYGQLIAVSGPIFTGLALWMGLRESDIALVASVVALSGLIQPFAFLLAGRVRDQKRFIITVGFVEVLLITAASVVPVVVRTPTARFVAAAAVIFSGMAAGNLVAPMFNSWFSTLVPEEMRARFLGRRSVLVNLAAMSVGYATGVLLDAVGGRYLGFVICYALSLVVGIGGYLVLATIPFPSILKVEGAISFDRALIAPFKNGPFRRLLVFYAAWVLGALMAEPFYSVFMIRDLQVPYATIGVLNSVVLAVGILGYWMWGNLVGRFGGKPVLRLLLIPRALLPVAWALLTRRDSSVLLPIIMVINGLVFSGLTVAINTLLFGTIPETSERSVYFAAWAFVTSLVSAGASAGGGIIARSLASSRLTVGAFQLDNVRLVFLISSVLLVVPLILVRRISDTSAKPVLHLLGQVIRGNPLAFVYNAFVFSRIRRGHRRARALFAMGRSRSPMAVDRLARALDDSNPHVREQAVRGLGETRAMEAVPHLVQELTDEESDIRAEAAESLGKLRHPRGIEALLHALDARDTRVAVSAARALGDLGGEEARAKLLERLERMGGAPDKLLLSTIVESLSRLGDVRIVATALRALEHYASPVIRLQLLNAACRALGARNLFYELVSLEEYERVERLDQMLRSIERRLRRLGAGARRTALSRHLEIVRALEEQRYGDMPTLALALAAELLGEAAVDGMAAEPAKLALELFVQAHAAGKAELPDVFSVVCLGVIVDSGR